MIDVPNLFKMKENYEKYIAKDREYPCIDIRPVNVCETDILEQLVSENKLFGKHTDRWLFRSVYKNKFYKYGWGLGLDINKLRYELYAGEVYSHWVNDNVDYENDDIPVFRRNFLEKVELNKEEVKLLNLAIQSDMELIVNGRRPDTWLDLSGNYIQLAVYEKVFLGAVQECIVDPVDYLTYVYTGKYGTHQLSLIEDYIEYCNEFDGKIPFKESSYDVYVNSPYYKEELTYLPNKVPAIRFCKRYWRAKENEGVPEYKEKKKMSFWDFSRKKNRELFQFLDTMGSNYSLPFYLYKPIKGAVINDDTKQESEPKKFVNPLYEKFKGVINE